MSIPVDDERVNLPLELLDYVLSLVPPSQLQHTTLALLSALQLPISLAALFRHLRLTRSGQSWQLAQLLHHPSHSDFRSSVRTVVVQAWRCVLSSQLTIAELILPHRDDPQLLANLLGSFPRVTALAMTVGPLFAPEQLEELLERPKWRSAIEQLSFRFNPYVEERSYYTFLKVRSGSVDLGGWRGGCCRRGRRARVGFSSWCGGATALPRHLIVALSMSSFSCLA